MSPASTATTTTAGARLQRAAAAVRVAGGVTLLVALAWFGVVEVALCALVVGALLVPRALRVPAGLDLGYGLLVLSSAWFGAADLYAVVGWLDVAAHVLTTGAIAAVAYLGLVRLEVVPGPWEAMGVRRRLGVVVVTAALGAGLGVAWEAAEWYGHAVLDDGISVGYDDTVADLLAGAAGSALAGLVLTRRAPQPRQISSIVTRNPTA